MSILRQQYLDWRKGAAVGCLFARRMSRTPEAYKQQIIEIPATTPQQMAREAATHIAQAVADDKVLAVALLFGGLTSLQSITEMAIELGKQPEWQARTTLLPTTPIGPLVAFHLTCTIPFGQSSCPSEALLFGDITEFPATRRAPVTALEIYVGPPLPADPKTKVPTAKANLAHWDTNIPSQAVFEKVFEASAEGRLASLGGIDDSRAKAKVSFVLPVSLAQQLGCHP